MLIDVLYKSAQENRKRFAATSRCIYQTTFSINNMLPCFFLEIKRIPAFLFQPLTDNFIAFCRSNMIQMVFCLAAVSVTFGLCKKQTQYLGSQLAALNIER